MNTQLPPLPYPISSPIQRSKFSIPRSIFDVRCSMFISFILLPLVLPPQTWANSIQQKAADLGALSVGESTSLTLKVPFSGDSQWITGVESTCSCLNITHFPETMESGENLFEITFTPDNAGPSKVDLTISVLDAKTSQPVAYNLPVAVVGVEVAPSPEMPSWIQHIDSATLHSNLEQYTLIDIRGSESYKNAHIPNSLEYGLDAFSSLSEQFRKPVVLVGDGLLSMRERTLLDQRGEIKGRPLLWLEGGLPTWIREGLPVQGTWPSRVAVATLSLQRWLETGGMSSDWEIVDLTGEAHKQATFFGHPVHLHAADTGLENLLLKSQENVLRSPESKGLLVVGDPRGLSYPSVEHNNAVSHAVPVYYLNQGDTAVSGWFATARGIHDSSVKSYTYSSSGSTFSAPAGGRPLRTSKRSGCRSCPKR